MSGVCAAVGGCLHRLRGATLRCAMQGLKAFGVLLRVRHALLQQHFDAIQVAAMRREVQQACAVTLLDGFVDPLSQKAFHRRGVAHVRRGEHQRPGWMKARREG